jgi:hypothetical protein
LKKTISCHDRLRVFLSVFDYKIRQVRIMQPSSSQPVRWTPPHLTGLRFKVAILVIVLVLAGVGTFGPVIQGTAVEPRHTTETTPHTFPEDIAYAGVGPTTISLNWTEDTNSTFVGYVLRESNISASGPWVAIANISINSTTTYYYDGLKPSSIEWWQVMYYDPLSHPSDNVLNVTQPSAASLSFSQLTSTSVQLEWNNHAMYGGLVSFSSYQLMESVDGGPYQLVATIRDVNVLNHTVDGLSKATRYSFYLNTTDECTCSPSSPSSSVSNTVTMIIHHNSNDECTVHSLGRCLHSGRKTFPLDILSVIASIFMVTLYRRPPSRRH